MAWFRSFKNNGGQPIVRVPEIIFAQSANRGSLVNLSYTFTESGVFQYYVINKIGDASSTISEISIQVNETDITSSATVYSNSAYFVAYAEISINADDVLSLTTNTIKGNSGIMLFVLKDAYISNFSWIGNASNTNATFDISSTASPYLQVYHMGFYESNNTMQYQICTLDYQVLQDTESRTSVITSIPTPNIYQYYYGGTLVIRL